MANRLKSIARWLVGAEQSEERLWQDAGPTWFVPGTGGAYVDESTALTLSAVWACETLIADSIATLPVDTFRKSGKRRLPTPPPRWVERPSEDVDRVDYDTQRILSLLGWGNAFSILGRDGGRETGEVMYRRLIEPWRVEVKWENSRKQFYIDGQWMPSAFVQHIAGHMAPGALTGMGIVGKARESFRIAMQADQFAADFYKNGVLPSGALEVPALPAEASKEVISRMRENVMEWYGGPKNAGKPLVLTGGTKWTQLTLNPVDAQFLETRKFQIEEVCRWFRVPVHKVQQVIGNASQGGGNGLEQMALEFTQDALLPWTVRLERADSMLLPAGEFLRYNLDAYVRVDLATRTEVLVKKRQNGILNADEWRALEDEEPIGGHAGSIYWMPVNMSDASAEPVSTPAGDPIGSGSGSV